MFSRHELKPWGGKNRADLGCLTTSKVERGEFNSLTKGAGVFPEEIWREWRHSQNLFSVTGQGEGEGKAIRNGLEEAV